MSQHRYTVRFEPAEEGGYVVNCPALPGLVTEGDTYEEAHDRAVEAMEGYLESLQKDCLRFLRKVTSRSVEECQSPAWVIHQSQDNRCDLVTIAPRTRADVRPTAGLLENPGLWLFDG